MNIPSPEQEKKERSNKQVVPGQNLDELAAVETGRGSLLREAEAGLVASSEKQASGKKARGPAKRKNWKKPDDMPKRPLSSYNLYFKHQRELMLGDEAKDYEIIDQAKRKHRRTHGKIGFAEMAKSIGEKWKNLDASERKVYDDEAHMQKEAYQKAMKEYKARKKAQEKEQAAREEEETASIKPAHDAFLAQQASQNNLLRQSVGATVALGRPTDLSGFGISLPLSQETGLGGTLDISSRLSGTSSHPDPSTLALSQLQLQLQLRQQQQEALQQNLLGSGYALPGQFQTGYSVDATRAALTAAFSQPGQQIGQPLLGFQQQLQQPQQQLPPGYSSLQQAQNFQLQQQIQARQLYSTEDLLRLQWAAMQRQSVGPSGTGLGGLPQGFGGSAAGLNTAPSITNLDPRLLEYAVAREEQVTQRGQLPPAGDDAKGSDTFKDGK